MNKFALAGVVVVAILVAIAMVGAIILHLERPDASATFIQQMSTLIGLVTVAAGVFYGFSKQGTRLDDIEKNTNGRLHSVSSERDDAVRTLARLGLDAQGKPLPTTSALPTVTVEPPEGDASA